MTDSNVPENTPSLPSGFLDLDRALGIGGYPIGRVVEIYGPESSGKMTLALRAIAEVQARGGVAAIIDLDHALDMDHVKAFGIDPAKLLVSQPDSGEQALDIAECLAKSDSIDLVVINSVANLIPSAEIMGDGYPGLQIRRLSQALRKLTATCYRTSTTFIVLNQLQSKTSETFGSPETTAGGNVLKFYSSVRLDVRRAEDRTRVKVVKNKCAQPFTEANLDLEPPKVG
jgi:recombination protein RecA